MKLRIAAVAFLLGAVTVGVAWLTLQPVLVKLLPLAGPEGFARLSGLLPFYLALDLVVAAVVVFVVLYFTVARPLRRAEESVEQLGRLDWELPVRAAGGPLLSRLESALSRMAEALRAEKATTSRQLKELRETNEALTRTQTELVASERLATVGKLAAGVAHEVGNPLGGILGYVSVARSRAQDNPEMKDLLDRLETEVQRIDQIVRGLLDIGRPARGKGGPVEVAPIAAACVKLAAAGPDFAGVDISSSVEPGTVAQAESGPLSQVLLNLLLNAAQAMDGKGHVELLAKREGQEVVLAIRDHGPGISPEARDQLFEPFFTTKAAGKGTGLGLAVCRHLVTQMGGQLSAANAEGGGAVFVVRLPAA
ncbi:MAG: sensor histidine kinase [Myxococcota bacterium]